MTLQGESLCLGVHRPRSIPILSLKKYLYSLTKHAAKNFGERKTRAVAAPGEIRMAQLTAVQLTSVQCCQFSHSASHRKAPSSQILYRLHVCVVKMLVVLKEQRSACWHQSRATRVYCRLSMRCDILPSVIHLSKTRCLCRFGGWFISNLNFV